MRKSVFATIAALLPLLTSCSGDVSAAAPTVEWRGVAYLQNTYHDGDFTAAPPVPSSPETLTVTIDITNDDGDIITDSTQAVKEGDRYVFEAETPVEVAPDDKILSTEITLQAPANVGGYTLTGSNPTATDSIAIEGQETLTAELRAFYLPPTE